MAKPRVDLRGLRVLVVEDNLLVADILRETLEDCGCAVVGPVPSLERSWTLIDQALDGALLDVNLAGDLSFPLASALSRRGIPFIFLTGYGQGPIFPVEFRSTRRIGKPFDETELAQAIAEDFARAD